MQLLITLCYNQKNFLLALILQAQQLFSTYIFILVSVSRLFASASSYSEHCCTNVVFQIRDIECLGHLTHLRVLNLAGNDITCVSNLAGLQALAELNIRRNRITHVVS